MSTHLKRIYNIEDIQAIFGKSNPSLQERAEYWEKSWHEWKDNSSKVTNMSYTRKIVSEMDLNKLDYVIRSGWIRFKNFEDLVYYKLISH